MATETKSAVEKQMDASFSEMESMFKPWTLVKRAFSSFSVVFLIGGGVLINWILAAIFLFGSFSSTSFTSLLIGLLILGIAFPALYWFCALWYGRGLVFWEAYQSMAKPLAAMIVGSAFERFLPDDNENQRQDIEEGLLSKHLEEKGQGLMDRLPSFISSKLEIVSAITNITKLIREENNKGTQREEIKDKATTSLFNALDSQLSGVVSEPSLMPVFVVALVNIGAFIYLMS